MNERELTVGAEQGDSSASGPSWGHEVQCMEELMGLRGTEEKPSEMRGQGPKGLDCCLCAREQLGRAEKCAGL